MERGLYIIAVKNKSILKVNTEYFNYPNFIQVNNYLEAAGFLISLREGINLKSLQRPLKSIKKSHS